MFAMAESDVGCLNFKVLSKCFVEQQATLISKKYVFNICSVYIFMYLLP